MSQNHQSENDFQGYLEVVDIYSKHDDFFGAKTKYIVIKGRFIKFGTHNGKISLLNLLRIKFKIFCEKISYFLKDLLCD